MEKAMSKPTLEISVKLSQTDGTNQQTSGIYEFPSDDEAEAMYWAVMNSAVASSEGTRDKQRGKSKRG